MAHNFIPSIQEADAVGSPTTERIPEKPRLKKQKRNKRGAEAGIPLRNPDKLPLAMPSVTKGLHLFP